MDTFLPLLGGLVLLIVGGELLVRGAVGVATRLGVSPLVIGLTLVGFGTSTPELVTSVQASLSGSPGIAYGNIVGSNMANALLILGASAAIMPIAVQSKALKRDGAVMLAVTLLFALAAWFGVMNRLVGALFLLALVGYIYLAFRTERTTEVVDHGAVYDKSAAAQGADAALVPDPARGGSVVVSLLVALFGLALVVGGGYFLVDGAVSLARDFGISETVIGLTIVAVGTSMPELVTSLVAAVRKQADVAFGNIIGSNIYNLIGIGGTTALIAPAPVPAEIIGFDIPVLIVISLLVILFAATGRSIDRREGIVLVAGYVLYTVLIWP
ncbi:calcium/sodium antiporter [Mongoliimonas terrestris]|uniref:calcium/sodium antiporter n=1 Tax=Mongoliimonas terrestris TaxID=1709001 RepID=UPI0009497D96|nr:calcium/sodium antiporter [Mongoliimonas terrestris]